MASNAAMSSVITLWCAEVVRYTTDVFHSYNCCSDKHASSCWTFSRQWISNRFITSQLKKWTTECCPPLEHVASWVAILTLLLRRLVVSLQSTVTWRQLFNPWVSLMSTYKTNVLCFEFVTQFSNFHLTLLRMYSLSFVSNFSPMSCTHEYF